MLPDAAPAAAVGWAAGVRAARAAGIPVFGITSGQEPAVLWEAGCCMLLQDFSDLVALAAQHCSGSNGGNGNGSSLPSQQGGKDGEDVHCIRITADSSSRSSS